MCLLRHPAGGQPPPRDTLGWLCPMLAMGQSLFSITKCREPLALSLPSVTDSQGMLTMPTGSPGKLRNSAAYARRALTPCERCGRLFPAARVSARYCSGRCRIAAWRERKA